VTNSSLIAIVGPTGSGKSALALAIAQSFSGEIVNFDSVQVYRGLNIGSAKTPLEERQGIPHHLLDVVSPLEDFTAGIFAHRARACVEEIAGRRALPVLVGGTGFYLRSLLDGLSPAPAKNPELRQRLNDSKALHRFLRRIDPAAAARIHANDRQKLIRAIELAIAVSSPAPRQPLEGFSVHKIGLNPDRATLCSRLNVRSQAMFDRGLIEETQALLQSSIAPSARAMQSLGYKQAVAVIEGRMTREEAIADVQIKTRQYAKRQMTWFRHESGVQWLDGFGEEPEIQRRGMALAMYALDYEANGNRHG
jgi:tRNA dimethylallyltransferase